MSDLIDRQAAIDALNKKKIYRPLDSDRWVISDCLNAIVNLPSAEPEIIRCKDCKFSKAYYHGSESNLGMFTYLCTQGLYGMNADDYCSRAERRADGAEHDN